MAELTVRDTRAIWRAHRETDPLGHAVLQSVADNRIVHVPYSAEACDRFAAVAASVEDVAPRFDPNPLLASPVLLSLGSRIYRGPAFPIFRDEDDGRQWAIRVDDMPLEVVS